MPLRQGIRAWANLSGSGEGEEAVDIDNDGGRRQWDAMVSWLTTYTAGGRHHERRRRWVLRLFDEQCGYRGSEQRQQRDQRREKKKTKKIGRTSRQIQPLQYEIADRSLPRNGFVVLAVPFVLPSTARKKDLQAVSERRAVSQVSHA